MWTESDKGKRWTNYLSNIFVSIRVVKVLPQPYIFGLLLVVWWYISIRCLLRRRRGNGYCGKSIFRTDVQCPVHLTSRSSSVKWMFHARSLMGLGWKTLYSRLFCVVKGGALIDIFRCALCPISEFIKPWLFVTFHKALLCNESLKQDALMFDV